MILIKKSKEPECLKDLRESGNTNYSSLKGECLVTTRKSLKQDQSGLCAYCQRLLKDSVFIEHFIPQSKDETKDLLYLD